MVAGESERTVEFHTDAFDGGEHARLRQPVDETIGGAHGPDSMRARWTDADLEQVKKTSVHEQSWTLGCENGCDRPQWIAQIRLDEL